MLADYISPMKPSLLVTYTVLVGVFLCWVLWFFLMYASSLRNTIIYFLLYICIASRIFNTDPDFTKYFGVFKLTHAATCFVGSRLEWLLSCGTESSR